MPIAARKPYQQPVSLGDTFGGRSHGYWGMCACRLDAEAVAPAGRPQPPCDLLRQVRSS